MTIRSSINGNQVHLTIEGEKNFDYTLQAEFCEVYKKFPEGADKSYTIDLSKVDYIDSSGLSMLLLLRNYAVTVHSKSLFPFASRSDKRGLWENFSFQSLGINSSTLLAGC